MTSATNLVTSTAIGTSPSTFAHQLSASPPFQGNHSVHSTPSSVSMPIYGSGKIEFVQIPIQMSNLTHLNVQRNFNRQPPGTQKVIEYLRGLSSPVCEPRVTGALSETLTHRSVQEVSNRPQLGTISPTENPISVSPLFSRSPEDLVSYPVEPKDFDKLEGIISDWIGSSDKIMKGYTPETQLQEYLLEHLKSNQYSMGVLLQHTDLMAMSKLPGYQVYLCRDGQGTAQALLLVKDRHDTLDVIVMIKNPKIFGDAVVEFGLIDIAEEMARESGKSEVRALPLQTYVWFFEERGYTCVENSLEMKKQL
jgi:hypothetical protein